MERLRGVALLTGAACLAFAGCAPNTRLAVEPTTAALAQSKRSVAIMKFSMPAELCSQHFLWLGAREGTGHRLVKRLQLPGGPPAGSANAAEIELEPGEYHVLGYACVRQRSIVKYGSEGGPHTASLASFTLEPGEVLNAGHLTAKRQWGTQQVTLAVSDWSLEDLNRFKDERPTLYAGMKTRLATLKGSRPLTTEEKTDRCSQLRALAAAGKVDKLPPGCAKG